MRRRVFRYFAFTTLAVIVVVAVVITLFVRWLTIDDIYQLAQRSNLVLARTALSSTRPELIEYLVSVEKIAPHENAPQRISEKLAAALSETMQDSSIVRIKLYNPKGTVVFSTRPEQIGDAPENHDGFESAVGGRIKSYMAYHDALSVFTPESDDDNLMSTYVPVRGSGAAPIKGVFEIYTDVSPLVHRNERTEAILFAGVGIILAALYGVLIVLARRGVNVILAQEHTIRERTRSLEVLTSQMLRSVELERRRVASELNEGVGQTLVAIKLRLDAALNRIATEGGESATLEPVVPVLQEAIQEVRLLASGLRPADLDDHGLVPSIEWLCSQIARAHPDVHVDLNIGLSETDVPTPLRIVVYRVTESVVNAIVQSGLTDMVTLELRLVEDRVSLRIEGAPRDATYGDISPFAESDAEEKFAEARERTTRSGGRFSLENRIAGGVTVLAAWNASLGSGA